VATYRLFCTFEQQKEAKLHFIQQSKLWMLWIYFILCLWSFWLRRLWCASIE
jgi:hypothetical protein